MLWKYLIGSSFLLLILVSLCVNSGEVWIDVRSLDEYQSDHVVGDTRITHTDIVAEVTKLFPDKNTEILLYCRSGRRAGRAQAMLVEAGYVNIRNIGGIDDARKERGLSN